MEHGSIRSGTLRSSSCAIPRFIGEEMTPGVDLAQREMVHNAHQRLSTFTPHQRSEPRNQLRVVSQLGSTSQNTSYVTSYQTSLLNASYPIFVGPITVRLGRNNKSTKYKIMAAASGRSYFEYYTCRAKGHSVLLHTKYSRHETGSARDNTTRLHFLCKYIYS